MNTPLWNIPPEKHLIHRIGWLRAAVLGANDGILSTASILTGMAAGGATRDALLLAGFAGLVAGASSMATGEYVSVSSQSDIERADLVREKRELRVNNIYEQAELAQIYRERGLESSLAAEVARQLMAHDALGAHARDELGIHEHAKARPLQAAIASAASFSLGGILPILTVMIANASSTIMAVVIVTLLSLALLGMLSAKTGGVPVYKPMLRVLIWGIFSMAITALIGRIYGGAVV